MSHLRRHSAARAGLPLTASLSTTPEIDLADFAGGVVGVPAGSPITTLAYHAAPRPGGTYAALHDAAGLAVVQTVAAGRAYPLPDACFGAGAIKLVANAAGPVDVALKG